MKISLSWFIGIALFSPFAVSQLSKNGFNYATLNLFFLLFSAFFIFLYGIRFNQRFVFVASFILVNSAFLAFLDPASLLSFLVPFKFLLMLCLPPKYFKEFNTHLLFFIKFVSVGSLLLYPLILYSNDIFNFFLPYSFNDALTFRVARNYQTWDQSAWFIFNNQVSLGLFCVCALFFLVLNGLVNDHKKLVLLLIINIVLTKSLLCYMGFLVLFFYSYKNIFYKIVLMVFGSCVLFYLFDFLTSGIEYSLYFELVRLTRGGILIDLLPHFFTGDLSSILLGINSDQIVQFIHNSINIPITLEYAEGTAPLEDVYYVYYLYQFGLIMFVLYFFALLYMLVKMPKNIRVPFGIFLTLGLFVNQLLSFTVLNFFFYYFIYHASIRKKHITSCS